MMNPALLIPLLKPIIKKLLSKIPDKNEQQRVSLEMEKTLNNDLISLINTAVAGQLAINKQEAAHKSLFVAGWRPAVAWCCVFGLMWAFIGHPIALWLCALLDTLYGITIQPPSMEFQNLFELLIGMLGLSGIRTYEKLKGISREK